MLRRHCPETLDRPEAVIGSDWTELWAGMTRTTMRLTSARDVEAVAAPG